MLEYRVPSSGTSVFPQTKGGISRGRRPKMERETRPARGRVGDRPAGAAGRQDQLGKECDEPAAWCWHSDYGLSTEQSKDCKYRHWGLGILRIGGL